MAKVRLTVAASLLFVAVNVFAQCDWIPQSGSIVETCGNVGIGTNAPTLKLQVAGGHIGLDAGKYILWNNSWGITQQPTSNNLEFVFASARVALTTTGNVGIGTTSPSAKLHVIGDAHFEGTVTGTFIKAHYQDVAEWVPSKDDLAPGTVVVLDANVGNGVMASNRAYDMSVAGVVSAQPGIILGEASDAKEMIATTGRVKVKVDASRAPIVVGDLLVTSDERGVAMKSEPIDINGRKFHQPGTIIGKALESLPAGRGEILVLLSLQ